MNTNLLSRTYAMAVINALLGSILLLVIIEGMSLRYFIIKIFYCKPLEQYFCENVLPKVLYVARKESKAVTTACIKNEPLNLNYQQAVVFLRIINSRQSVLSNYYDIYKLVI